MMHLLTPFNSLYFMKRITFLILLACALNLSAQSNVEDAADLLSQQKFNKLYRCFTPTLKKDVSKKQLKMIWLQTVHMFGELESVSNVNNSEFKGQILETALLKFKKGSFELQLTHKDGDISGLMIRPLSYSLPSYGKGLPVGRRWIDLKVDSLTLPGELMLPSSGNECPLVILVHGSGPNDMDETIGPNKVFNDLALGLAKQGIASYRYDKRSKVYPQLFSGQFDIYDETVSDALLAIQTLASDTSLHFTKIIALGHSLGGFAMPMIADSSDLLDGAVLFSANARPLNELMVYQVRYLSGLDGDTSKAERKVIEASIERAAKVNNAQYDETTPASELMAYWPGKFWQSIASYDQVATAAQLNTPLLILQGEKDYQITMTDFQIWQEELGNKDNVQLISYPGLTHLFTPTDSEMSTPADYYMPQNVDEKCILDIASWIKGL